MEVSALEKWLSPSEAAPVPSGTALTGLDDLSKALVLSRIAETQTEPMLVVFPSRVAARNALDNFSFFCGRDRNLRTHYVPCIDFDFHRGLLPNPEILCERNVSLFHALNDPERRVFFTTVRSLLQKVIPSESFLNAVQVLKPETELQREDLLRSLYQAGYQAQPSAYDPGVFAVRGGVIDIFSPLYESPFRIEFFGDTIESIRLFDPSTQRSLDPLEKAFVVPVGQTLFPKAENLKSVGLSIKDRLDHLGVPKNRRQEMVEKIERSQHFSELSLLFPLLSQGSVSPFHYFPKETKTIWDGVSLCRQIAEETELPSLHRNHELYENEPIAIAERNSLFVEKEEFHSFTQKSDLSFETFATGTGSEWNLRREEVRFETTSAKGQVQNHLAAVAAQFREWIDRGMRVHVVCHTQTHAERFQTLLEPHGIRFSFSAEGSAATLSLFKGDFQQVYLWQGFITQSQYYPDIGVVLLSEEQLFGRKKRPAKSVASWSANQDPVRLLTSFRDLKQGDLVVHKEQGIGRYLGLKKIEVQGIPNDFVALEYRDGDKLYVPIYRLNVLQKYVGSEGASSVAVDKLGGDRWIKAKGKALKAVAELAGELLKIQAQRKLIPAHSFSAPGSDFTQFEMEFPYDETPDQQRAIDDVMKDLGESHPMDRLVCGDVGYGKTEIAMRAAYRCVLDGKQVAVLVPTTVLAFQHFETFKKRFQNTPAQVRMVSRLRSTTETRQILTDLKDGKIDILIGTHRLLSSDVGFKDLGLVVVDEEHRFGVVHKERLKRMSQSVHYLTMTATPIPRTLNMALSGIKDISVITTPPPDRLSVRTFVSRRSEELIREAVLNETAREGQVFFVHNRIETQSKIAHEIHKLLPRVKVEVVHGQMEADNLEEKMLSFYRGESSVLLTTAIIESGLDIPRANTIIIDKADHFGLAQLYQLRGRVGRSDRRAYCYLLIENENVITEEAKERLQVIQRYSDLGAGFHIAGFDLELRGAGDLLGKDQSGHLTAIGVDYYFELLDDSIRHLRGEEKLSSVEPEISLPLPAFFPEIYLPDLSERVNLYRRLSSVTDEEQVSDIEAEIRDRFGVLPEQVTNLLGLMRIKLYLKKLRVVRMGCGPKRSSLQFDPSTPVSPEKIVSLVGKNKGKFGMTPDGRFQFEVGEPGWRGQLKGIQSLCSELGIL